MTGNEEKEQLITARYGRKLARKILSGTLRLKGYLSTVR
jgi:hypothetical protein